MSSDGGSYARFGMHVGSDWWVTCSTYDDHAPILGIDAGGSGVSVYFSDKDTTKAVEFARALLREVQLFADETERFLGNQADGATPGQAA